MTPYHGQITNTCIRALIAFWIRICQPTALKDLFGCEDAKDHYAGNCTDDLLSTSSSVVYKYIIRSSKSEPLSGSNSVDANSIVRPCKPRNHACSISWMMTYTLTLQTTLQNPADYPIYLLHSPAIQLQTTLQTTLQYPADYPAKPCKLPCKLPWNSFPTTLSNPCIHLQKQQRYLCKLPCNCYILVEHLTMLGKYIQEIASFSYDQSQRTLNWRARPGGMREAIELIN